MTEWKEYKLGEVGEIITGKTPSVRNPEDWGNNFLFITPSDYCNYGKYAKDSIRKLSVSGLERLKKKVLPPKSILVTCIGSDMGKVVMNNVMCITNQQINAIVPYKEYDNDFVYYSLLNAYDTLRVLGGDGTAVPIVNKSDFENIVLKMPSLVEQKRIAGVLSSLDDKIDLLNRENATLEALAETLFRHYFIENPDPEWKKGKLTEFIKIIGGGTPKTSEPSYWNGDIGWLSGGDISENHKNYILNVEKYITQKGVDNSSVNVLPENSMIISARGTVGKYCLLGRPMAFSQSNYGILPKINGCYFFTYLLVSRYVEEMKNAAYGSVFDTITTKTFESIDVFLPSEKKVIVVFDNQVKPIFEKLKRNQLQIQALLSQRDTLLPRLMTGEVKTC